MSRPGARPPSPRPRACWRCTAFTTAAAGTALSALAFAFCAIAWAYDWHRDITKPGIGISAIVLIGCAVALNLTVDDE